MIVTLFLFFFDEVGGGQNTATKLAEKKDFNFFSTSVISLPFIF